MKVPNCSHLNRFISAPCSRSNLGSSKGNAVESLTGLLALWRDEGHIQRTDKDHCTCVLGWEVWTWSNNSGCITPIFSNSFLKHVHDLGPQTQPWSIFGLAIKALLEGPWKIPLTATVCRWWGPLLRCHSSQQHHCLLSKALLYVPSLSAPHSISIH